MLRASLPEDKSPELISIELESIWERIEATSAKKTPASVIAFPSWKTAWISGLAAAAVLLFTFAGLNRWSSSPMSEEDWGDAGMRSVAFVHSDIAGASSMVIADTTSEWTIIWVDEPERQSAAG
jgi:hypothetical protein